MSVKLTADLVEAFAGTFLSPLYDNPVPTPPFHRECWALYCSDAPQAAIIAPRNHAKSTSFTHDYGLAVALFRNQSYIMILGSSEEMAIEHLNDISVELHENDDLRREFGVKDFVTDQKTDLIVECRDGYQFRFVARGAEQKIRGRKWRGQRPGLILGDDIEDDEQVENKDRRQKFYRWLLRAAKQALRDGGKIRIHGTILHEDSALAKIATQWRPNVLRYRAHASFDDFSNILWPEKFDEARLREIRRGFVEARDAAGYSQEYLNDPLDNSDAYLNRDDFIKMNEDDYESDKVVCAAADFAVSKEDMANRTSFTVGGKDANNILHILDNRAGRWDSIQIINEMFSIQQRWNPDIFWVEAGQIWKALQPMLYKEMQTRERFINIVARASIKDKATRGRSLQRRMRAGGTRWDQKAEWYTDTELELLKFTGYSQATLDDKFDSASLLSLGFDDIAHVEPEDFTPEEELEMRREDPRVTEGRSSVTGY